MFKKQVKFEIFFYLTVDILCPVLGNEKVDAYHTCSIGEKSSWILREITSNFKERAKFRTRKKPLSL